MSRSYCITLNNYTLDELETIYNEQHKYRYLILGAEVGESGTKHLQGYIELWKPQRISYFKDSGLGRAHLEKRQGSRDAARGYCIKDGDYVEFGTWESGGQGSRNDLKNIIKAVRADVPLLDIMTEMPESCSKHLRFIEKYTALYERETTKEFRHVDVEVLVGASGAGKTRKAREYDENIFLVDSEASFAFDGYNGEKTILIDEFYGGIKYSQLLRILDGHQYRVNVKGSHRYAKWNKVFITSNDTPDTWYRFGLTPALARRISRVTTFGNEEPGNTMPALADMEKKSI